MIRRLSFRNVFTFVGNRVACFLPLALFGATSTLLASGTLFFHLECQEASDSCKNVRFIEDEEEMISITVQPSLTFAPGNIVRSEIVADDLGQEHLDIQLKRESARKLSQLTAASIGKRLVLVLDNQAAIAPVIKSEVGGEWISIAVNRKMRPHLPSFLSKKGSENGVPQEKRETEGPNRIFVLFAVLGSFALAFFLFFRRRRDSPKS